jgi:hypothetical protein
VLGSSPRLYLYVLTGLYSSLGVSAAGVDIWADCEYYRQEELELLLCHGLQVNGIVVGLDAVSWSAGCSILLSYYFEPLT